MSASSKPLAGMNLIAGYTVVLAAALAWQALPPSHAVSGTLFDHHTRVLRSLRSVPLEHDVVVIGLDSETLSGFPEPVTLWHRHFGRLLALLGELRPALVIWDIVLPEKSFAFLSREYDPALLSGLIAAKKGSPVVVAQTLDADGRVRKLFAPIVSLMGEDSIGLALVPSDIDGTVRRMDAALEDGSVTLFGRALEKLGKTAGGGYINYSVGDPLGYLPMHDVLQERIQVEQLRLRLAGKIVLIGANLPFEDRHLAPVELAAGEPENRYLPGVMIQAQAIRAAVNGHMIAPLPPIAVYVLLAGLSLLWWYRFDLTSAIAVAVPGIAVLYAASLYALSVDTYLPLAAPAGALLLAVGGRFAIEAGIAFRERQRYKTAFARYVSPAVMREILAGHIKPNMQAQRRRTCLLFSDIRSFTSRSENEPPETIVELLNEYFEEMVIAVHRHGGTVDKFIGDGLMAFFGAPAESPNPAADAVKAAKEMLHRLTALNERLTARGAKPVAIGIGIHIGDVVVGHVGSTHRYEYTAIGDTVNTASRLEGLTKSLDYPLVVSSDVAKLIDPAECLIDLGEHAVKGRAPVAVFGWRPTTALA